MFAQERHHEIIKIVQQHRRLVFSKLQALMKVSPATLRRDLVELERSGAIIRVHGGVLDASYSRSEISFDERLLRNGSAKKAIALKAAEMIPSGSSVFVDAGSSCLEVGKILLARKDLRLVTHSVALLSIALHGKAELICVGGGLRRVSGALVGGAALGALAVIRTDYAIVGATGMDLKGCYTTELSEAEMKKAILRHAGRTILLADSSKWQRTNTIHFADWSQLDDWVTNKSPSPPELKFLRKMGLAVHFS